MDYLDKLAYSGYSLSDIYGFLGEEGVNEFLKKEEKMKTLLLINHNPANELIKDLEERGYINIEWVGDTKFKDVWSNIPTSLDIKDIENHLKELIEYISKNVNFLVIAGEPSAICVLKKVLNDVKFAVPVSERISKDISQEDGTIKKISIFKYKGLRTF